MAYPEPRNLDDIYGPGAEVADILAKYDEEELAECAECRDTWPVSELDKGICPDCLLDHFDFNSKSTKGGNETHFNKRRH